MGRQSGTSNWTAAEIEHLLSVIETIVPLNPADWDEVKAKFDVRYAKNNRALSALQRKFQALHRTKEPTGDPNIPSPVLSAQRIKRMIEDKTDGTRGSPDSELKLLGDDDEEGEEDEERDAFYSVNADDTVTPLTRNAVSELSRLSGHGDKQFFEPIVQVIHLKKQSSSKLYDVRISDGISYMMGTCAEAVSKLVDEEYFMLFSYIKVQEFSTTTRGDGAKLCQLLLVENPMIPNPGEKIGNPIDISHPPAPGLQNFSSRSESPFPASIAFGQSIRAMKGPPSAKKGAGGGSGGDEFNHIMYMMMMQQQSDREQRIADREHRNYVAEQDKIERKERARQLQLEREERANQAREDRIQQQQDRMQQQQFLNMMMMQMMGGGNKRAREDSNSNDDNETLTTPSKKTPPPRKK
jgi:hypothetical protein